MFMAFFPRFSRCFPCDLDDYPFPTHTLSPPTPFLRLSRVNDGGCFGAWLSRVNAVGQVGSGPLRRLRLEDPRVRAAVRGAASVRELFADDAVADEYPVDPVG